MTVYVVAQLTITDQATYRRYLERFRDVFNRYGGTVLAADSKPQVVEGTWDREKVV